MGFDLTGLNPDASTPQPMWNGDDPMIKTGENNWQIDPQIKEEYDDYMKSRWEWQDANEGAYFRNNVWFWRPLWRYVCSVCYNILSDKDMGGGSFNDGYKISKTKAKKIAKRLRKCLKDGHVELTEAKYKQEQEQLPDEDCDICDATGKRQKPPKTGAGDVECNGCNGTGKRDNWDKSYPFHSDNVREFERFCEHSGGFQIW